MEIFSEEKLKKVKKSIVIDYIIVAIATVLVAVAITLLLIFQTRRQQFMYTWFLAIATFVYLTFVWLMIREAILPARYYRNLIRKWLNEKEEEIEEVGVVIEKPLIIVYKGVPCKQYVLNTDGREKAIYIELTEKNQLKLNHLYKLKTYESYITKIEDNK